MQGRRARLVGFPRVRAAVQERLDSRQRPPPDRRVEWRYTRLIHGVGLGAHRDEVFNHAGLRPRPCGK
jgi:hypothetical protein